MKKIITYVVAFSLAVLFCPSGQCQDTKKPAGQAAGPESSDDSDAQPLSNAAVVWSASRALLSRLSPPREIGRFSIRVPSGFVAINTEITQGQFGWMRTAVFRGPKRAGGSTCTLTIVTVDTANNQVITPDGVDAALDSLLDSVGQETTDGKDDLVITDREYGTVNGLRAAREYFKFTGDAAWHPKMHGFNYATVNSQGAIVIAGLDSEPYSKQTMPLLEALTLTLKQ